MSRRNRKTAAFALGAVAGPWLAAALAVAHVGHHSARDHGHAREVAAAVHGHEHEAGTPEHEHLWASPAGAPHPGKVVLTFLAGTPGCVAADQAFAATRVVVGAHAAGHDPPRRSISILRI